MVPEYINAGTKLRKYFRADYPALRLLSGELPRFGTRVYKEWYQIKKLILERYLSEGGGRGERNGSSGASRTHLRRMEQNRITAAVHRLAHRVPTRFRYRALAHVSVHRTGIKRAGSGKLCGRCVEEKRQRGASYRVISWD